MLPACIPSLTPALHCTALHGTALHCLYNTGCIPSLRQLRARGRGGAYNEDTPPAGSHGALHCTALHCTAPHCTALHSTALHSTALHCTVHQLCGWRAGWGAVAGPSTTAQCRGGRSALTVLHCTALHCTALHCNDCIAGLALPCPPWCSVLSWR
jgi:hypothetical protein